MEHVCSGVLQRAASVPLSQEQRATIDQNRRRALQRRHSSEEAASRQDSQAEPDFDSLESTDFDSLESTQIQRRSQTSTSTPLSQEQRATIDQNRRRALVRRHSSEADSDSQQQRTQTSTPLSQEQRANIEQNRRRALERRQSLEETPSRKRPPSHQLCSQQAETPGSAGRQLRQQTSIPLSQEQLATVEQNRQRALERRSSSKARSSLGDSDVAAPCPSGLRVSVLPTPPRSSPAAATRTLTPEQRGKIEQNRQAALERRRQRLLRPAASAPPAIEIIDDAGDVQRSRTPPRRYRPLTAELTAPPLPNPIRSPVHLEPAAEPVRGMQKTPVVHAFDDSDDDFIGPDPDELIVPDPDELMIDEGTIMEHSPELDWFDVQMLW